MQIDKNKKIIAGSVIAILLIGMIIIITGKNTVYTDNAYLKSDVIVIRPKVNGYITEILVQDNQYVKEGDIIAKIDDRDYQLRLQEAQNNVDVTISNLSSAEANIVVEDLTMNKASLIRDNAKTSLDLALKNFNRAKGLISDKAMAQKDYDKALEVYNNSKNMYDSADSDCQIAALKRDVMIKTKESMQDQLKANQAKLELAKLDLDNTLIKANLNGFISNRNLQIGQLASNGMALGYIVADKIWVIANFKETQTGDIKIGNNAKITVDSISGRKFIAKVDSISPATGAEFSILPPENATGNFTKIVQRVPIKLIFDPQEDLSMLRSGLSCEVTIDL